MIVGGSVMKVCYIAVDVVVPFYRGASTHVYEVARYIAALGHDIHVISRRISAEQPAYEVLNNIHIHRIYRGVVGPLPFSKYQQWEINNINNTSNRTKLLDKFYECYLFTIYAIYAGLFASSIIEKYGVEVIIERETSFGAGAIASIVSKRPMILEVIGPRYSKLSFKRSKKVLAYTPAMIHDPISQDKLVLVTAAADVEKFRPDLAKRKVIRKKYGLQDSLVIGYVGTFAEWHGIKELIDASVRVIEHFPNVKFLMVGPYFENARKLVAERGVTARFVFTGPVPYVDVPSYINAADILLAPYNPARSELRRKYGIGSPLKLFEYMACGKPVVTTSVSPIDQVIQNGKNALIVPPGDSAALASAIISLAQNPQHKKELGKAAREEVVKRYSWKSFAIKLDRLLKQVVNK
jgi:glycosyltransferase involved in cell wall biosynthesis